MVIREISKEDISFFNYILDDIYSALQKDYIETIYVALSGDRKIYVVKDLNRIFCYELKEGQISCSYLNLDNDKLVGYGTNEIVYNIKKSEYVITDFVSSKKYSLETTTQENDFRGLIYTEKDDITNKHIFLSYSTRVVGNYVNPYYLNEPVSIGYRHKFKVSRYVSYNYNINPNLYMYNIIKEQGLLDYLHNKDLINYNAYFYYMWPFVLGKRYKYGDIVRKLELPPLNEDIFNFYNGVDKTFNFYEQLTLDVLNYEKERPKEHSRIYFHQ